MAYLTVSKVSIYKIPLKTYCHDKIPQIWGGLSKRNYCLIALEFRSGKSVCCQAIPSLIPIGKNSSLSLLASEGGCAWCSLAYSHIISVSAYIFRWYSPCMSAFSLPSSPCITNNDNSYILD